jgi:hypothetical protein
MNRRHFIKCMVSGASVALPLDRLNLLDMRPSGPPLSALDRLNDTKRSYMIRDFKVICNETNNTPELIDKGELNVDVNVWVAPIHIDEHIKLKFVMSPTGIEFTA